MRTNTCNRSKKNAALQNMEIKVMRLPSADSNLKRPPTHNGQTAKMVQSHNMESKVKLL